MQVFTSVEGDAIQQCDLGVPYNLERELTPITFAFYHKILLLQHLKNKEAKPGSKQKNDINENP